MTTTQKQVAQHTPEPWSLYIRPNLTHHIGSDAVKHTVFDDEMCNSTMNTADALRIVACVNACASIQNPSQLPAVLKAVRDALGRAEYVMEATRDPICDGSIINVRQALSLLNELEKQS